MQVNPDHQPIPAPFTRNEWCALITAVRMLYQVGVDTKAPDESKVIKALSSTAQRALERIGGYDYLKDLYTKVYEGDTAVIDLLERSIDKVSKDEKSIYPNI